jgi:YebC/PmpR family DNA-binding regulatory protein
MGRAFELRRARKEKRWGNMSKLFTKIGKELSMAVKNGGGDPESNPKLRVIIQNAKNANMPKDRIESAIKRASSKDESSFEEMVYEGYGPYGVAIVVECATDNPTRTVASVRSYLTRAGGSLGKTGSLDFLFERKSVFKLVANPNLNLEELEFELIDFGAEQVFQEDENIYIYAGFSDFGNMQKALEEKGIEIENAKFERFPTTTVELNEEQQAEIETLIEKFEDDDDVQAVFHNMK